MQEAIQKADTLIEALQWIRKFRGKITVIKLGGSIMEDERAMAHLLLDVVFMESVGMRPVVVHGGGPQLGAILKKLGVESRFVDGLRVTDQATADVAEMVLSGAINKELVGWIAQAGGKAIGISGKDGGLVSASKVSRTAIDPDSQLEQAIDLGFVGEPESVDTTVLNTLSRAGMIPIVAPIAADRTGQTYNINADTMAGAIAAALGAARLFLLTDVPGVLDKEGRLLTDLTPPDIVRLKADGTISGGMIPKLETCVQAVEAGCEAAVVLAGRVGHAMLLEFFTSTGAGTLVRAA